MEGLTIGQIAQLSGLPAKTIRFYEQQRLLPAARRSESGYRLYSKTDAARLQLVRRAKALGLGLAAIKVLVDRAFAADCTAFAEELLLTVRRHRSEVQARLADLVALEQELDAIELHVQHCCEGCDPADVSADCDFCGLIETKRGGDRHEEDPSPAPAAGEQAHSLRLRLSVPLPA